MTTSRRNFLELLALGAVATAGGPLLAGCSEKPAGSGAAQNLDKFADLLPARKELALTIQPDIKGVPPIPDGFTKYPATLVDAITEKPGTSGKVVTAMTPVWGPAPPGYQQSAYLQAVNAELGTPVNFAVQDGTYGDKLNAIFGARDVPELLCVPDWEVARSPRMADAVKVLFEDLTDHLRGDAAARYPMLATFPAGAWRNAIWNERLAAVPAAPGYREIRFAPQPGGDLTSASAKIHTPYGEASIAWTRHESNMLVDVVLPPGTSGRFVAPPGWSAAEHIGTFQSGQHHFVLKS